jgi:nucleotide-binding universal stress UspA family protein
MLKKILLALDGSENSEKAIPWVKRVAAQETAQVVLLRVVPSARKVPARGVDREEARDYLLRMEKELNYAGVPTKVMVRRGRAPREIVDAAREEGCDLILMATRGESTIQRWALGGVTEQVLRLSTIPVLPVRSQLSMPRQGHVSRVIVPVDGSTLAEAPLWWSARLARLLKAKLIFLHVYPNGAERKCGWDRKSFDALQRRLTQFCRALSGYGVKASFRLQRGDAAARIINYADEHDLILTTTHGFGGIKRLVFGSVAEKLIHEARVPVLVYKAPA